MGGDVVASIFLPSGCSLHLERNRGGSLLRVYIRTAH